jgi:DNA-binding FadR family transcriptional regulator
MDLRLVIEPKAARWAAERGTQKGHNSIRLAMEAMKRDAASIREFVFADALFHSSVLRAANNELLCSFEGVILSALLESIRLTNRDPRENDESLPFHRAVAEAIFSRDAEAAESRMEGLLGDAQRRLRGYLGGFEDARKSAEVTASNLSSH